MFRSRVRVPSAPLHAIMKKHDWHVTLDKTTQEVARMLAKARYTAARSAGVVNAKKGPQSNKKTDLEGVGGELAFCLLYNLWPDMTAYARKGGHDCVTHSGTTVDVKTTKYKTGHLLVRENKFDTDTEIYALVIGEFPNYEYVGWATADEVRELGDRRDGGFWVGQGSLHSPDEDIDTFIWNSWESNPTSS